MMDEETFNFDEIGYWSELKLEILEKYGKAYQQVLKNKGLKRFYIDGFCGAGAHRSKLTGKTIEGSPSRALKIMPPFDRYYFIDLNRSKTSYLKQFAAGREDVEIVTGDSNEFLANTLLPLIDYTKFNRALCLLDPYGLHLNWEIMRAAGQSRAVDMLLNFPVMDMNRNAVWRKPDAVPPEGIERMNRFWGDDSWRAAAYLKNPQANLFGDDPGVIKQGNDQIVEAFRRRLRDAAGFKHVAEALPIKNSVGAIVYYLMFASQSDTGLKIITDIFSKYK